MSADPTAFRDQIGGVKARLQEQYQREAFQTPEYEYDFYYEDEAHSLAKSTVKKIEFPSNSHIFFNSPTPATTPCKMASLCENGVDEDENEDNSIVKSSIKMTSLDVEVVEMESMKFEINLSSVLSDANTDVSGSEILPICPTTPSRACFESAFTVLKSVKKSPFKASVSKTEVQTPLKSVKKSPFKASASKKEIQNPTVTIISSNFTFEVESEGLMNSVSTDINEIVEIDTVTNTVNLVADIMTDGGAVFDIPAVELIMLNEEIIPITVDTVISPSLPEAIMTVNNFFWAYMNIRFIFTFLV